MKLIDKMLNLRGFDEEDEDDNIFLGAPLPRLGLAQFPHRGPHGPPRDLLRHFRQLLEDEEDGLFNFRRADPFMPLRGQDDSLDALPQSLSAKDTSSTLFASIFNPSNFKYTNFASDVERLEMRKNVAVRLAEGGDDEINHETAAQNEIVEENGGGRVNMENDRKLEDEN